MRRPKASSSSAAHAAPEPDADPSPASSPASDGPRTPWSHHPERAQRIAAIKRKWTQHMHHRLHHPLISEADREELFQEVLTELAKQFRRLDGPDAQVMTFVLHTADNYRRNHLRKLGLPVNDGADVDAQANASPDPETQLTGATALDKIQGYLPRLPPDERQVFQAHAAGIPFTTIASLTGRSETQVRREFASAQKKLRAMIRGSKRGAAIAAEVVGAEVVQKK